jgi:hypothetical protein
LPSLEDITRRHQETARRPARQPLWSSPGVIAAAVVGAVVLGGLAWWLSRGPSAPAISPIARQTVDELDTLELNVAGDGAAAGGNWQYRLAGAPKGATLDPGTGRFSWRPAEDQGPGWYDMTVQVVRDGSERPVASQAFSVAVNEVNQPPVLAAIEDRSLEPGGSLAFKVAATDPDVPAQGVVYRLAADAPQGAEIDGRSGEFRFTPATSTPGQEFRITIRAQEAVPGGLTGERSFQVRIAGPTSPVEQFLADLRRGDAEAERSAETLSHPFSAPCCPLSIDGELVGLFEYASADDARGDAGKVSPESLAAYDRSGEGRLPVQVFQRDRLIALYGGGNATVLGRLESLLGKPLVSSKPNTPEPAKPAPEPAPEVAKTTPEQEEEARILKLYDDHKLFQITEYAALRNVFASRFERENAEAIRGAFEADADAMLAWLDEHRDVKEELYTAIKPAGDDVTTALGLFNTLRKEFPDQLESYANLAIATAVTWDREETGVYDYTFHSRRTRSTLPEGALGAVENFRYMLQAERYMQGRGQFLPWEFLVHVVNHKTPLDERGWAVRNYLPKRVMFGQCYADVPYDTEMLNSGGQITKLDGLPYTLENIARYGGVCAMQADFAARVGKSIGVPAESVSGESRYGESHAWVMWVELKGVSKTSIAFSLESFGRYRGDKYYVGNLRDPQTGEKITDRQLELRLHTVGMNPRARRHAERIMACYPLLREKNRMDVSGQLAFLNRVIELCPGNEEAWRALARMSREGVVTVKQNKAMMVTLDNLFRTFAAFPDFTWEVFDDLIAFQDVRQQRARLYGQLVFLYEQADRPDLACEARLKYADYLVEEEDFETAIQGLAAAIKRFPAEGRYVPRMLDKLEEICDKVDGADQKLLGFYREFLPMIPQKRGTRPSAYCTEMYQRAIKRFRDGGQEQMARLYEAQLAALTGESPRS